MPLLYPDWLWSPETAWEKAADEYEENGITLKAWWFCALGDALSWWRGDK